MKQSKFDNRKSIFSSTLWIPFIPFYIPFTEFFYRVFGPGCCRTMAIRSEFRRDADERRNGVETMAPWKVVRKVFGFVAFAADTAPEHGVVLVSFLTFVLFCYWILPSLPLRLPFLVSFLGVWRWQTSGEGPLGSFFVSFSFLFPLSLLKFFFSNFRPPLRASFPRHETFLFLSFRSHFVLYFSPNRFVTAAQTFVRRPTRTEKKTKQKRPQPKKKQQQQQQRRRRGLQQQKWPKKKTTRKEPARNERHTHTKKRNRGDSFLSGSWPAVASR